MVLAQMQSYLINTKVIAVMSILNVIQFTITRYLKKKDVSHIFLGMCPTGPGYEGGYYESLRILVNQRNYNLI